MLRGSAVAYVNPADGDGAAVAGASPIVAQHNFVSRGYMRGTWGGGAPSAQLSSPPSVASSLFSASPALTVADTTSAELSALAILAWSAPSTSASRMTAEAAVPTTSGSGRANESGKKRKRDPNRPRRAYNIAQALATRRRNEQLRREGKTPPPPYIPKAGLANKRKYERSGRYRGATLQHGGKLRAFSQKNAPYYLQANSRFCAVSSAPSEEAPICALDTGSQPEGGGFTPSTLTPPTSPSHVITV